MVAQVIGCLARIFGVGTSEEDEKAEDARRARVRARKIKRIGTALVDGLREQSKKSWATEHDNAGLSRLRRASMGTVATVIMQLQQHNGKRSGTNDDDLHIQHSVSKAATECVRRVVCVAACVEQGMCAVASRCSRVTAVCAGIVCLLTGSCRA